MSATITWLLLFFTHRVGELEGSGLFLEQGEPLALEDFLGEAMEDLLGFLEVLGGGLVVFALSWCRITSISLASYYPYYF